MKVNDYSAINGKKIERKNSQANFNARYFLFHKQRIPCVQYIVSKCLKFCKFQLEHNYG